MVNCHGENKCKVMKNPIKVDVAEVLVITKELYFNGIYWVF